MYIVIIPLDSIMSDFKIYLDCYLAFIEEKEKKIMYLIVKKKKNVILSNAIEILQMISLGFSFNQNINFSLWIRIYQELNN